LVGGTATVTVAAGGVSARTIVYFTNADVIVGFP
jgi:hypothetical protein